MEAISAALVLAISLITIQNILVVALGLGLVIFFHELGHFAVAKWCNVNVERFSIGFGPILLSWKWGETEYALSLIPFGGYVKMLGQDDADPAQMASLEVEQDPRSYTSKNVLQRMAIISAGVIMNVVTGLFFFAFAFYMGVDVPPSEVGTVVVGKPAWKAGLQEGDLITSIDGREISTFGDIIRLTALSSSKLLHVEGVRYTGEPFQADIAPEMLKTRREIGVGGSQSLTLPIMADPKEPYPTVVGSAAAAADPRFLSGDTIVGIDGQELKSFAELQNTLARKRAETVVFNLQRSPENGGEKIETSVRPQNFRGLGLWMDIGPIEAVQVGSPAEKAGMLPGDKIVRVKVAPAEGTEEKALDLDVGKDLNSLTLPEFFADRHGKEVTVVVTRESPGSSDKQHEFTLIPNDRPGWVERPLAKDTPLSVPAIGVAFHIIPTVLKVEEGSPAEGKVKAGDQISQIALILPEGQASDAFVKENENLRFPLDESNRNWATAFWLMQIAKERHVRLTVKRDGAKETLTHDLVPKRKENWYLPVRGIQTTMKLVEQKAEGFSDVMPLSFSHTVNNITDIYMTLRNLVMRNLSVKELHGPIGIAQVAYKVSKQGLADLSHFLGILSINLAVLNFLPIPLLDGGHMVFLLWEGITRRKPSEKVLIIATYIGMAFVLGLLILVIFLDVVVHGLGLG